MFGMFFAFWVFSAQKCGAVIFSKFELACMHARPLRYLDMLYLFRAGAPCIHVHNAHARCDVTRFGYNANPECPGVVSTTCCCCHTIWFIHDAILCDSSIESSALCLFIVVTSSYVTCLFNPSVHHPFIFITSSLCD